MKILIVNADDFGFTKGVNVGIVRAHCHGILTATSLLANGQAFDHAVELARQAPQLDIGVHLTLIGGVSLVRPEDPFPESIPELLVALATRRLSPYDEFRAQVERILARGLSVSHLDTHKHIHLIPAVLKAVLRIAREFGIPWIRKPFDLPAGVVPEDAPFLHQLAAKPLRRFRRIYERAIQKHGLRTTDHFVGFQLTGVLTQERLLEMLNRLPTGVTEFMCHPGLYTEELERVKTRLKQSRQVELELLTAPEVRELLKQHHIQLSSFRQLTHGTK